MGWFGAGCSLVAIGISWHRVSKIFPHVPCQRLGLTEASDHVGVLAHLFLDALFVWPRPEWNRGKGIVFSVTVAGAVSPITVEDVSADVGASFAASTEERPRLNADEIFQGRAGAVCHWVSTVAAGRADGLIECSDTGVIDIDMTWRVHGVYAEAPSIEGYRIA